MLPSSSASSAASIDEIALAFSLLFHDLVAFARIPDSTYRLQFNKSFTFKDAHAIVDYLHALGISDCYASSYLTAVPGSPHGYDVADPTTLNPEIGTDADYWSWIDALSARHMGHVLDLVPNHMGIAKSANPWWQDVLENGPSSRFARFFDIEWHPVKDELADKLLIPILGDQYGAALERQELQLAYDHGAFVVRCYDNVLPIAADTFSTILSVHLDVWLADHAGADADELQSILTSSRNLPSRSSREPDDMATRAREKEVVKRRLAALTAASADVRALVDESVRHFNGVAGQPRSFDDLDRLLNQQSYRLAHWRVASEEINYRRFFDVNQLAALRMEDPAVFEEVHRFALELVHRGAATGLRVDHVDGLYAPGEYLAAPAGAVAAREPFFIVVEKILGAGEQLPHDWPVAGTTGYEFAAVVNNLFVDGRNARALEDISTRFIRERRERLSFADLAYRSKKQVMHETMSGDINSLGHQLNRFSERNRHFRDFTLYSLISTIKEVIACFPVYRTYVTARRPGDRARQAVHHRGDSRREAAGARRHPARVQFHRAAAAQADAGLDAGGMRRPRAVHREIPADHQPGRGERHRRHRAVRAQPAAVAERGGRRSDLLRSGAVGGARVAGRTAAAVAVRAFSHVDARHQARRGRPRAAERVVGNPRCVEGGGAQVAVAEPPLQDGSRRRARPRSE